MGLLTSTVLLSTVFLCGATFLSLDLRIGGGSNAYDGQYPYMASLRSGKFEKIHFCGGAIIHKYWILTAAHCLERRLNLNISVHVGTNYENRTGIQYDADYVLHHAQFSRRDFTFDIGLVKTKDIIQFNQKVKPILLPLNNIRDTPSIIGVLTGWGIVGEYGRYPILLQELHVALYDYNSCKRYIPYVAPSQICTSPKVGQGACSGDSGGPLVFQGVVIGIASYVLGCSKGYPDVYTRVYSHLNWIIENTRPHEEPPKGLNDNDVLIFPTSAEPRKLVNNNDRFIFSSNKPRGSVNNNDRFIFSPYKETRKLVNNNDRIIFSN